MALINDGDVLGTGDVKYKTVSFNGLRFHTKQTNDYTYWTTGDLIINGTSYTITASNSGVAQADKIITVSLDKETKTGTVNFRANTYTISSRDEIYIGYVDSNYKLTLIYSTFEIDLSTYTLVKATGNVSISGQEGFFVSAIEHNHALVFDTWSCIPIATSNISVNIDGSAFASDSSTKIGGNCTSYWDDSSIHSFAFIDGGFARFENALTITFAGNLNINSPINSKTNSYRRAFYWVK